MKQLSEEQKNDLCLARVSQYNGINPDDLTSVKKQFATSEQKAVVNIVFSKFFAWATGTVDMNKLVDDGRPAVYFGFANLRIEDREGNDVSAGLRGESSKLLLQTLNSSQLAVLNNLIADQKPFIDTYFETRADIATMIMKYRSETATVDPNELAALCLKSEIAESELGLIQAKEMSKIIQSLSAAQMKVLTDFKEGNGN